MQAAAAMLKHATPLRALAARPPAARPLAKRFFGLGGNASDNDPKVLEREKARNLSGATERAGESLPGSVPDADGWNPQLASDAEAVVKAERAPDMAMEELVEFTVHTVFSGTGTAAKPAAAQAQAPTTAAGAATAAQGGGEEEGAAKGGGKHKGAKPAAAQAQAPTTAAGGAMAAQGGGEEEGAKGGGAGKGAKGGGKGHGAAGGTKKGHGE